MKKQLPKPTYDQLEAERDAAIRRLEAVDAMVAFAEFTNHPEPWRHMKQLLAEGRDKPSPEHISPRQMTLPL
ncbi:hypothetical protein [Rufibacter latericius]|uniref:Uncharacterized protein n=1 Tax=Rufibacter latericius TaxID=2487040 RepID=A0A3M9MMA2_9BACT|nr:hypothetical protein [Rufibacter latericius]RNI26629.1 hypothetical protein EFB08_11465 [Rufibacter latericius]